VEEGNIDDNGAVEDQLCSGADDQTAGSDAGVGHEAHASEEEEELRDERNDGAGMALQEECQEMFHEVLHVQHADLEVAAQGTRPLQVGEGNEASDERSEHAPEEDTHASEESSDDGHSSESDDQRQIHPGPGGSDGPDSSGPGERRALTGRDLSF
jgi:hypothetical protein